MKVFAMIVAAVLGIGAAAPSPARAGTEEIVRVEVIDGGRTERGTHLAALRLTLADGWKTYWRVPGEAGLPPIFDWTGSRNVGSVALTWPAPTVFDLNGLRSIGYSHELVLPIEITPREPGGAIALGGSLDIGVCRDICVPASLDFDSALDATAGRSPAIAAALARRPHSASEGAVAEATCRVSRKGRDLAVDLALRLPSTGAPEVAVIEPGTPALGPVDAAATRNGDWLTVSAVLPVTGQGSAALDRSSLRITVLGSKRAVEIRGCTAG